MPRTAKRAPRVPGNPQGSAGPMPDIAQPVRTPTGMPYGQAGQLAAAQRAIPLPAASPSNAAPLPPSRVDDPEARLVQALSDARGIEYDETPFNAPTERPNEPLTTGMAGGAGAGPEILGPRPGPRVSGLLDQLARSTGSTDIAELAALAARQDL